MIAARVQNFACVDVAKIMDSKIFQSCLLENCAPETEHTFHLAEEVRIGAGPLHSPQHCQRLVVERNFGRLVILVPSAGRVHSASSRLSAAREKTRCCARRGTNSPRE